MIMMRSTIRTKRWTRLEYERLIDLGAFQPGDRVELVGGDLMVCEPQGTPHITGICMAEEVLRQVFADGWEVRTQAPVALDDESEPEPDGRGPGHPSRLSPCASDPARAPRRGGRAEPRSDRQHKGSLYARARVPEYWIINLVDNLLEVYRDPIADPAAPFGWRYGSISRLGPRDFVSPLEARQVRVAVADLLP